MCKTQDTTQQPVPQADPSTAMGGNNPIGASQGSAPSGADPLSQTLSAEAKANPDTVSVSSPTKFGKLASLLKPILVGGAVGAAVGGATGKSTYGGGFAGANNFFATQHQRQLQSLMVQRQAANDQFHNRLLQQQAMLDTARTAHEINRPNFTGRSVTPTPATNAAGQPVLLRANPTSGEMEEVPGYTPSAPKPTPDSYELHDTDQGIIKMNRRGGKITPATLGGDETEADDNSGAPASKFDSGSPRTPGTANPGKVSRVAPGGTQLTKSKTAKAENPDAQDYDYLTTPKEQGGMGLNPDQARAHMESQKRLGQKSAVDPDAPLVGDRLRKAQTGFNTRLTRGLAETDRQQDRELDAVKKDNTLDDDDRQQQIQEIQERYADRKQDLHQELADEADEQNVPFRQPPNYRSKIPKASPKAEVTTPEEPSLIDRGVNAVKGLFSNQGKVQRNKTAATTDQGDAGPANATVKAVTPDIVQAWATKKNISVADAQKQFKAKGYTLGGNQ